MTDPLYQQVLAIRLLSTMLPLASPSLRRVLPQQTELLHSVIIIRKITRYETILRVYLSFFEV